MIDLFFESISNKTTYSDCVNAVAKSGILGSTAERIIDMIPIGTYPELYSGIVEIVKADYLGSTKERMIRSMISKVKGAN